MIALACGQTVGVYNLRQDAQGSEWPTNSGERQQQAPHVPDCGVLVAIADIPGSAHGRDLKGSSSKLTWKKLWYESTNDAETLDFNEGVESFGNSA